MKKTASAICQKKGSKMGWDASRETGTSISWIIYFYLPSPPLLVEGKERRTRSKVWIWSLKSRVKVDDTCRLLYTDDAAKYTVVFLKPGGDSLSLSLSSHIQSRAKNACPKTICSFSSSLYFLPLLFSLVLSSRFALFFSWHEWGSPFGLCFKNICRDILCVVGFFTPAPFFSWHLSGRTEYLVLYAKLWK